MYYNILINVVLHIFFDIIQEYEKNPNIYHCDLMCYCYLW